MIERNKSIHQNPEGRIKKRNGIQARRTRAFQSHPQV
jgi:hypothetical protein